MIAKVLMVSPRNASTREEVVYEHTDDNKTEAIRAAKLANPKFYFGRVWLGEPGQHRVGKLAETSSKLVQTICETGGFRKLKSEI